MKRTLNVLVLVGILFTLLVSPVVAQQSMCVGDRVIDPDHVLPATLVADWPTASHNMDRLGINLYLFAARTADVAKEQTVGEITRALFDAPVCDIDDSKTVILGIAPGVEPGASYEDFAISEISYGSTEQRDRLQGLFLPGHSENVMLEYTNDVEDAMVDGSWPQRIIPETYALNEKLSQLLIAPAPQQSAATAQQAPTVPPPTPQKPTVAQPVPSAQRSGTNWVIILILIIVLLTAIYFFATRLFQDIGKVRELKLKAKTARTDVARLFNQWSDNVAGPSVIAGLRISEIGGGDIAESEIQSLRLTLREADAEAAQAGEEFTTLGRRPDMDPDTKHNGVGYATIVDEYTKLLKMLNSAKEKADRVAAEAEELRQTASAALGRVQDARDKKGECEGRVDDLTKQGFVINPQALFEVALSFLSTAENELGLKRLIKASEASTAAIDAFEKATAVVETLPEQKAELEKLFHDLGGEITAQQALLKDAPQDMQALQGYNPAMYADINGNIQEAQNRFGWAGTNFQDMRAAIDEQHYEDAHAEYVQAMAWLGEVHELLTAIMEKRTSIEEARDKIYDLIVEARRSIAAAQAAVTQHDDIMSEDVETDLAQASTDVDALEQEFQEAMPDYLNILRKLREIDVQADSILARTQEAAQAVARLKGKMDELYLEAQSSAATTGKYIDLHKVDVRSPAEDLLAQSLSYLEEVRAQQTRLSYGHVQDDEIVQTYTRMQAALVAADKAADDALTQAKKDVQRAEEARQPVYHGNGGGGTNVVVINTQPWGAPNPSRPNRETHHSTTPTWSTPVSTRPTRPASSGTRSSHTRSSAPSFSPAPSGTRATKTRSGR